MALIACPEYGRDASDQAIACPHCGRPFSVAQPVTVQLTNRRAKGQQAAGVVIMLVGAVLMFTGSLGLGAGIGAAGLLIYLAGSASAWWQNG